MNSTSSVLERLMAVIVDRQARMPDNSYTARLLSGGPQLIGQKIREEADEVARAALEPGDAGKAHLVHEVADLAYHLLVALAQRGASLGELEAELARRFGVSGLEEKASRSTAD